jgi:hypothetical protein
MNIYTYCKQKKSVVGVTVTYRKLNSSLTSHEIF